VPLPTPKKPLPAPCDFLTRPSTSTSGGSYGTRGADASKNTDSIVNPLHGLKWSSSIAMNDVPKVTVFLNVRRQL
jgi:hypothetical protein